MSLTRIPGNQVPVLEQNGLMSREWYRFFYNLFQLTGGGSSDITPAELQAEVDALDTADDVFRDCIQSVKKSFKKHDYKPFKGKTVEDAAAAICTDSRKEGGATLNWGSKRRREVEKARPARS